MHIEHARARLLEEWARYLSGAATQSAFTRRPLTLRIQGVIGPRAGALELYAGVEAPKLLTALARNNAALLRQFVPWSFTGEPAAYMSGRFVRVEAGWPPELAETMIRLADLSNKPEKGGRWVAGKTENGATVVMGLTDATSNYLVSGQTGSGKTVALRSVVLQLSRDQENRIVLVDGKMGEGLGSLAHLPGVVGPVATDGPTARAALGWVTTEMKRRYQTGDRTGRVIAVVDEFQEWADDAVFVDLLNKLAAQGRAARVHLIAATQHPTVSAFGHEATRRNLTGKLALRVGDPDASRVAVGGNLPRADYLLGQGDAYAVGPGACHRVQMAYVSEAEIETSGAGEWEMEDWGDLDGEAVGLDVPAQQAGWQYNGAELAQAIIAAVEEEGRPKLIKRLQSAGLGKPGSERAARLLTLGRETKEALFAARYWVSYNDA
ncbi:MAG: hypothetical protein JXA93_21810 [Anaerolineae bacterium]|nr:hypothetical protein [Anaerolineae bacterium]